MFDLDALLRQAARLDASDLHLSVDDPPTFRVHGELARQGTVPLSPDDLQQIAQAVVPADRLDQYHKGASLDFALTAPEVGRLRVSVYRQRGTPALAIRRISSTVPALESLNLPASLINLASHRRGLILVTGPTGSGKSTTLASMIDRINRTESRHIITLEDPIEYVHASVKSIVHQREVGPGLDVPTFAEGVRSALRQDPDVLLIGELRDLETMTQALQAAETGHLVLATLHAGDAPSTVERIINACPADQQAQVRTQLASTLRAVISQRLLRRADATGLIPAVELLIVTQAIQNLIINNPRQIHSAMQTGQRDGQKLMSDAVQDLAARGLISQSELQAFCRAS